jgi:precorrin-3B synthase
VPGGRLTPPQARALAAAASELGDGHLDLTSRANLQLRGLTAAGAALFAGRLRDEGLLPSDSHERVRNIVGSPLSGRGPGGLLDVTPLIDDLDHGLCADPSLAELPGRFLFVVDDGSGDVAGLRADVAVRALSGDRVAVTVGRDAAAADVPAAAAAAAAVAVARAFLDERARQESGAWRVAELPGAGRALLAAAARFGALISRPVPPPRAGRARAAARRAGVLEQRDGRRALCVVPPLGRLSAAGLRRLADAADAADAAGDAGAAGGALVVTPWRSLVVPDLEASAASVWSTALAGAGFVLDPDSPWVGVTACAGRPSCERALADVRSDAAAALSARPPGPPGPLGMDGVDGMDGMEGPDGGEAPPVHWSGCERRCGAPGGPGVEVLATPEGYEVRRNGVLCGDRLDVTSVARVFATLSS